MLLARMVPNPNRPAAAAAGPASEGPPVPPAPPAGRAEALGAAPPDPAARPANRGDAPGGHASSPSAATTSVRWVAMAGEPGRKDRRQISPPSTPSTPVMMMAPQLRYHSLLTALGHSRFTISALSQTTAMDVIRGIQRAPHPSAVGDRPRHCL